jgi:NAD+ synthetase
MNSNINITLAQINPTVGDITGNIELMRLAALQAQSEQSEMVIFPELSLTGYYPSDLLDEPDFLARVNNGLNSLIELTKTTPTVHWVIGAPTSRSGVGKALENSLLVILNGETIFKYAKQLLPTYSVFDERRHFEPGPDAPQLLKIRQNRIGFMICEDGWNDDQQTYTINPIARIAGYAPDLLISINASPSNIGKHEQRLSLFTAASKKYNLPIVYVNQVGGQDQLVFDGGSFIATPQQGLVFELDRFKESIKTVSFEGEFKIQEKTLTTISTQSLKPMEFYRRQIILGLRDYARRCGFKQAVVGSSGGIDSALTLALAVEALGPKNVVAITMPSRFSSSGSVDDSILLCQNLGIPLIKHPIGSLVKQYEAEFYSAFSNPLQGLALENLQARIRGTILMEYSNAFGHLLLTTGNKSEISVGYCTLYGDTNGGLGLIGDLYKTEIFELCRHINDIKEKEIIPNSIINKAPSAELAPGQRDDDSLPSYLVLDTILKILIEGDRLSETEKEAVKQEYTTINSTKNGQEIIKKVKQMIARSEYKRRQSAPILRLRGKAFGTGRQMPIAAKYE